MKILYLITKSNWGGAQRHVFDLATTMKDRGHDVAVGLGSDGILRTKLEAAGIYTHAIRSLHRDISARDDIGSFKEIIAVIRHRRPDVLHLHSPKAAGLGSLAGRLLRVPLIIGTIHGWSWNEPRPLHERMAIIFFSWLTVILCHKTIVISERERMQAIRLPGAKNKITLVPLGIRLPIFVSIEGAKQAIARQISIEPAEFGKKIIIGTIAELHPNKGLPHLIDAFASVVTQYPNSSLVIIGDGQDKASLNMLIREKCLESSVFLAGYIDNAAEYLKAFSIFVLPSIKEGLPYVILEAGSASLPVVATTVGGIPEIVEDMHSGVLVQPKNVRELSHAISFMIEHPDERRKYGMALRDRVVNRFSFDRMIDSIETIYKQNKPHKS